MIESKKGISANQLKRTLGVSYKTAWYLCHRIRSAMQHDTEEPLDGIVEADETWVGGRIRHKRGDTEDGRTAWRSKRALVIGAVEREGDVRLRVEKRATKATFQDFLREHVADDAEAIFTDQVAVGLGDSNTRHETVNHSDNEWVRGDVHTQTIEGVWSLFKRSIIGSYHHMSIKHLPSYLDEMEWRYNNRENPYLFRDTLLRLIESDTLPYRDLIGDP
jgi:transposase-like protein